MSGATAIPAPSSETRHWTASPDASRSGNDNVLGKLKYVNRHPAPLAQVPAQSLSCVTLLESAEELTWSQGAPSIATVAMSPTAAIDGAADGGRPTNATIRSARKARRMSSDNITPACCRKPTKSMFRLSA